MDLGKPSTASGELEPWAGPQTEAPTIVIAI